MLKNGSVFVRLFGSVAVACAGLLSGCALPGQGPSQMDVALQDKGAKDQPHDYALIRMEPGIVQSLGGPRIDTLSDDFSQTIHGRTGGVLGKGDRLAINVWEASADGLFSTAERKQTGIEVEVDESGEIYLPYVGALAVAGKSVNEVRAAIEEGLQGKAAEPQVQVVLLANMSSRFVVVGDVEKAGRYPIPVGGVRMLEALAMAGGSTAPVFETEISIVRGPLRSTVRLDDVLACANNNVWLESGDTINVVRRPRTFSAFGAVSAKNHISFGAEHLSLAEALAQAGGLNDNLADAGGVFLFRFESPKRLDQAGQSMPKTVYEDGAATIYHLNFNQPQAFFLASTFMMHDKDILYVSNAPAAEFYKFIRIFVNPILGVSRTAIVVGKEFE